MPDKLQVRVEDIEPYFNANYSLFPLIDPHTEKNHQLAKRPRDLGYKNKQYPFDELIEAIKSGCNLGYVVPPGQIVIDFDPRGYKKGINSYEVICKLIGFDLLNTYPSVITGSGGCHIYASVPQDVRLRKKIKEFPGVDWLHSGKSYVVISGSLHPNGTHYTWHNKGDLTALPSLPDALVQKLRYAGAKKTANTTRYSPEHVNALLNILDPINFSNYDEWLTLMFSCHHATGGDPVMLAHFVEWSMKDPHYEGQQEQIAQKWSTVTDQNESLATAGHLMHLAKQANFNAASYVLPAMAGLTAVDGASSPNTSHALVPVDNPPVVIPYTDKDTTLNNSCFLNQNYPEGLLMDDKDNCYSFSSSLAKWIMLPWELLKTRYQRQLQHHDIKQTTIELGLKGLYKYIKQVNLINPCILSYNQPEFFVTHFNTSAIPLQNGLFLPEAYVKNENCFITYCASLFCYDVGIFDLNIQAECPRWLGFLRSIWENDDALIFQLQQWMGYCLLKGNFLQKIGVFVGAPRAGKSIIIRILQECVTKGLSCTVSLDKPSEHFGLAGIVNKYIILIPEARATDSRKAARVVDVLKTISGGDSIDISRKYKSDLIIEGTQKINIVCNEFPNLFDHSGALATRFVVFPFGKSFLGKEDVNLLNRLKTELSGIFNWILAGLKRVWDQQRIMEAPSSLEHKKLLQNWTQPLRAFFDECCELKGDAMTSKEELYDKYVSWSLASGMTKVKSRKSFSYSMTTYFPGLDFNVSRRDHGKITRCVRGIALKKS